MAQLFEHWSLDFSSGVPAYRQIVQYVQSAVVAGRVREGDQLPTIRSLHQQLDINPNTVAKAYRELQLHGLVCAEQGSGCFIAPVQQVDVEKQARIAAFAARVAKDAHKQGIELSELIAHLNATPNL